MISQATQAASTRRIDGYAPIRDYAAIGDGRTVALVARDGSVDWLCLPDLDSRSVFAALLDSRRGGFFALEPQVPYAVERRYVPATNVLETTFSTAEGVVRVTDALTLPRSGLAPLRELARRIEGVSGAVPLRWRVEPRFGYAASETRIGRRGAIPVATGQGEAVAVSAWEAGNPAVDRESVAGDVVVRAGARGLVALTAAAGEPLVFPSRHEVERRLDETASFWASWANARTYEGPWRDAVVRSALALKLLVHAPSGAIAAAATTSLPETIGGERNWDYRFSWLRDSAFALHSLLTLGCAREADAFFSWLMHASQPTRPELQLLYRLHGGAKTEEQTIDLAGYRESKPVRIGNGAFRQRQLDIYGELFETVSVYARAGNDVQAQTGGSLAEVADLVCEIWRETDAGIWEVRSENLHFTQSKVMCWVALDRASRLVEAGQLPGERAHRWRREAEAIREFVETRCWSERRQSYVRAADSEDLDASVLLAVIMGYASADDPRFLTTIEAICRELASGPFVYRYRSEDGLTGEEGAFLACSFWLVEALVRCGRIEEAGEMMDDLVALANDVGLYPEEIDPQTGEFLGNFPLALSHLGLVSAAVSFADAERR